MAGGKKTGIYFGFKWSFSTRCASVFQAVVCLFEPESIGFLLLDVRLKDWSNTVLDYGKE